MKVVCYEQDCLHEDVGELAGITFGEVNEEIVKSVVDSRDYRYSVSLDYEDDHVKIFQAIEDVEGESCKFICINS